MLSLVTVITPSIPGREHLLSECLASVAAQTHRLVEHLWVISEDSRSSTVNKLAEDARGEWIFQIDDDDVLLPCCVEHHLSVADEADVVYAPPLVWGEDPQQFCASPPGIPVTSLIRTELWRKLGGQNERLVETEDMDFYQRAMDKHARFIRFDKAPTWVYRFHGGNKSRNGLPADS
jgi:glycosyltransferase involved in cell wall biosynthesis